MDAQADESIEREQKRQGVHNLVSHWRLSDSELRFVLWLNPDTAPVLLVQVTESTLPSPDAVVTTGFYPTRDFPFPMTVAQVTPSEFDAISRGELALPDGWTLDGCVQLDGSRRAA